MVKARSILAFSQTLLGVGKVEDCRIGTQEKFTCVWSAERENPTSFEASITRQTILERSSENTRFVLQIAHLLD